MLIFNKMDLVDDGDAACAQARRSFELVACVSAVTNDVAEIVECLRGLVAR